MTKKYFWGRFLEIVVQVTMMKFNREKVPGAFFGKSGEVEVPLFQFVDTRYVKGSSTRQYQIDVYGRDLGNLVWICECKYTKKKMGIRQVEKLEQAAKALRQEAEDARLPIPDIRMWLVSTGGFTGEVLDYVRGKADIFVSDDEGINGIFQMYGGNYRIPVFI
ncbi:MAG: hypothetical protein GY749_44365 [Desulfobacteraceae bacterium]|nr:hypothetical protein [Desulfobacteraceae bacterium]